jgi:hypothetical protein
MCRNLAQEQPTLPAYGPPRSSHRRANRGKRSKDWKPLAVSLRMRCLSGGGGLCPQGLTSPPSLPTPRLRDWCPCLKDLLVHLHCGSQDALTRPGRRLARVCPDDAMREVLLEDLRG